MPSFKIDENMPEAAVELLAEAGYDASSVVRQGLGGSPDQAVSAICRPPSDFSGIIVLRVPQDRASILATCRDLLGKFDTLSLDGALWIVEPGRVRVRKL